jgi:hypothetical protein
MNAAIPGGSIHDAMIHSFDPISNGRFIIEKLDAGEVPFSVRARMGPEDRFDTSGLAPAS